MLQNKFIKESHFVIIALVLLSIAGGLLFYFSESTYDTGDGIRHYLISRYSWNHPHLFLDSWGKPFFTLVSSPFSQFGMFGAVTFNILCGSFSAFFSYKIVKKLGYSNSWVVIFFLLFTPIYFLSLNSGLTEPFFGLVLILSIFLASENKFLWSAIVVSFLPFVRTEGFILLPAFFLFFVYYRAFVPVLFLSLGTLVYSLLGFLCWNDFLWILHHNPYNGSNREAYGSGDLLMFVERQDYIWGNVLSALMALGILLIIIQLFLKKNSSSNYKMNVGIEKVLVLGCFAIYFVAHSIMWWKGLANSMGLVRVFAGVAPCTAILCLKGANLFLDLPYLRNKLITLFSIICLFVFVCAKPFQSEFYPFVLNNEQLVIKEAALWMKANKYNERKIYYLYPYMPLLLDFDAFDGNKAAELWGLYPSIKKDGIGFVPDGTIVFWDAHFGPNECGIPLDTLLNDLNFDLLHSFFPKEQFTTLGNQPFTVRIFEKRRAPKSSAANKLKKIDSIAFDNFSEENILNKDTEFGKNSIRNVADFDSKTNKFVFSCKYLSDELKSKDALVVFEITSSSGKNLFWQGQPFSFKKNEDKTVIASAEFIVHIEEYQPTDVVKIYIWNKNKQDFSVKENQIHCFGRKY